MTDRNTIEGRREDGGGTRWLARIAALALGGILVQMFRSRRRALAPQRGSSGGQASPLRLDSESVIRGHETHDVRARSVAYVAIGLAVGAILAFSAAAILLRIYQLHTPPVAGVPVLESGTAPGALYPTPRLQYDTEADLLHMRAHDDSILSSYGWVNRDSGIVRIPIEQAMSVLAARGETIGGRIDRDEGGGRHSVSGERGQPLLPDEGANALGGPGERDRSGNTDQAGRR
ncbi:MAG TPA: hypothetical protein VFG50_09370 [Rhodothermales bacterium]|nr:hypothetical protein [Rhodothermales bacterium]